MKYSQIIKENHNFNLEPGNNDYKISILSNIIVYQLKEILEYNLRIEFINAQVNIGKYDNIVQESFNENNSNAIIIFWELSNLSEGFQYKVELLDNEDLGKDFYETLVSNSNEIRFIDFDNIENNSFNVVTELTFKNDDEEFRPDITILINGIPLVFIEVKKPKK